MAVTEKRNGIVQNNIAYGGATTFFHFRFTFTFRTVKTHFTGLRVLQHLQR